MHAPVFSLNEYSSRTVKSAAFFFSIIPVELQGIKMSVEVVM